MSLSGTIDRRYTIDEYIRLENDANDKHEFHDGEIIAMAGSTPQHSTISTNIIAVLHGRLQGSPCRVHGADLRIRVPRFPSFMYADALVICGPISLDPEDKSTMAVINPRVIVEVLSPTTEYLDRGRKFTRYLHLDSLQEYVLVSQDEPRTETFFRQSDGTWSFAFWEGTDAIARIRCLDIACPHAEVYAGVEFAPVVDD